MANVAGDDKAGDRNLIQRVGRTKSAGSDVRPSVDQEPALARVNAGRDSLDTFNPASSRPGLDREPGGRRFGRSAGRR
jgi:hypothetical protein